MATNTYIPTGTIALIRTVADLLESEGVETSYLSILGNWGANNMPLVSIDEQAFRMMFFGCEVEVVYDTQIVRMNAERFGVMWQATGFQSLPGPVHSRVTL